MTCDQPGNRKLCKSVCFYINYTSVDHRYGGIVLISFIKMIMLLCAMADNQSPFHIGLEMLPARGAARQCLSSCVFLCIGLVLYNNKLACCLVCCLSCCFLAYICLASVSKCFRRAGPRPAGAAPRACACLAASFSGLVLCRTIINWLADWLN